jgi:ATP-dependent Clp protease ATP-binding subunit ClpB
MTAQIELESLRKETDIASVERKEKLERSLTSKEDEIAKLTEIWDKEKAEITAIKTARSDLEIARLGLEQAQRNGDYGKASELRYSTIPRLQALLPQEGSESSATGILHDSVTPADIEAVVSRQTGIPVTKLMSGEIERLVAMEDTLRESVRGQDEALTAVANAVRSQRAGLSGDHRPIASFFMLGPTGTGKTLLCKKLASFLFSAESAMIRFDMSEFQEKHTVSRLIGSPAGYVGYEDAGQLSEAVRRKPYAVLLFDEIEKAHRDIAGLLLQVLDEGFLTDAQGHKVDFRNTIIVLTSNIGAELLVSGDTSHQDSTELSPSIKDAIMKQVAANFPPEFINRIDDFIFFRRLSKSALRDIVDIRLNELQARLDDRRIMLNVEDQVKDWLTENSYDPRYGARPLNRLIQKSITTALADRIIRGEIRSGQEARINVAQDGKTLVVLPNS